MTRPFSWLASGAVVAMTVWACAASPADAQLEPSAPAAVAPAPATPAPAPSAPAAATPPAAPTLTGQQILEYNCMACHDLGVLSQRPAGDWPDLIERMIGYGANLSASDRTILLDYLTKTYSAPAG